jgi:hypothetical protein
MKQRTLHDHFESTYLPKPASKLSFLDLPYEARHCIYAFAGLVRVCPIDFNFEGANTSSHRLEGERWRRDYPWTNNGFDSFANSKCFYRCKKFSRWICFDWELTPEGLGCVCDLIPYGLLYVSKAIYDEVSSILYSENKFKICQSNPGGLRAFANLGPRCRGLLTSLAIRLNSCSCVIGHCCPFSPYDDYLATCEVCHHDCRRGLDKLLGMIVSRLDRNFVSEWSRICDELAADANTRLRLSVICDISNIDTVEAISNPLQRIFLKECAVRLGQGPKSVLQVMARSVAQRTTQRLGNKVSRVLDLPGEIQDPRCQKICVCLNP